ncbi:hypothetical protein ACFQGW_18570 [Xanthomonas theicola]|uniref:hypothetical protein n=1 Tax=Xanthomonas theicola TaxID=56464 RepID=UPI00360A6697
MFFDDSMRMFGKIPYAEDFSSPGKLEILIVLSSNFWGMVLPIRRFPWLLAPAKNLLNLELKLDSEVLFWCAPVVVEAIGTG